MEKLHVVSVATGMVYSMALTDDRALFYWVSSDPDLKCQQLCYLNGKKIVSISAGKYWHGAVTSTGLHIYTWDGKKGELDEGFMYNDMESDRDSSGSEKENVDDKLGAEFKRPLRESGHAEFGRTTKWSANVGNCTYFGRR
ncbi:hypothetical protein SOVF_183730 isoform B [Spinacia oleracea]|nr:hypothetical protein SOVF_183730 isoform B [Spinacia oleracea]